MWSVTEQKMKAVVYDDGMGTWDGDMTFAVVPGSAVLIFARAPGTWDIVGSHNKGALNIVTPMAPNGNWIGLPINENYGTILDLALNIGDATTWEIQMWSVTEQKFKAVVYDDGMGTWDGDVTYTVNPGDAVLIFARAPGSWTPLAVNP
jgi:hypothetical protein